jgi:hypothetical protein
MLTFLWLSYFKQVYIFSSRCIETQQYKQEIVNHIFQKELETIANAWATKFVNSNLQPHLSSWLQELNTLFPKELPFNIARLGTTCFPTMKIP